MRLVRFSWLPALISIMLLTARSDVGAQAMVQIHRPCALTAEDQAWIDRSIAAWRMTKRSIIEISAPAKVTTVIFSADCVLTSNNAMTGDGPINWSTKAHTGSISLPDGEVLSAGVTSFASEYSDGAFFVMSTPSVWRAGGVPSGPMGLEKLMTAVLLHEGTHVSQFSTYMREISSIVERQNLPDDFNDDSIQKRFEGNKEFAASVVQETELLFAAATAADSGTARRLASQARDLIKRRRIRFYRAGDGYLARTEDVFLALEGSGQWAGYRWLADPKGGATSETEAIAAFGRRSKWWSQNEGLALLLALDRMGDSSWRAHAFGGSTRAGVEMLDAALENHEPAVASALTKD